MSIIAKRYVFHVSHFNQVIIIIFNIIIIPRLYMELFMGISQTTAKNHYPQFTDRKAVAHKAEVTGPRSLSRPTAQFVVELRSTKF